MSVRHVALVVGVGIVTTLTACTRDRARPYREGFEPVVARYMEDLDIPGLAVVVADRDGVIYRHEWGSRVYAVR